MYLWYRWSECIAPASFPPHGYFFLPTSRCTEGGEAPASRRAQQASLCCLCAREGPPLLVGTAPHPAACPHSVSCPATLEKPAQSAATPGWLAIWLPEQTPTALHSDSRRGAPPRGSISQWATDASLPPTSLPSKDGHPCGSSQPTATCAAALPRLTGAAAGRAPPRRPLTRRCPSARPARLAAATTPFLELFVTLARTEVEENRHIMEEPVGEGAWAL